jgi:DNA-binding NtrC family response regulator
MNGKILIVEDEFIIASDLRIILESAGYEIAGIAASVPKALEIINLKRPAWVFLDIYLSGKLNGIDLAKMLVEMNIPFIYVSANSNQSVLQEARMTRPYGFLVKPFRKQDVLVTLDVAKYRHENDIETQLQSEMVLKEQVMKIFAETISKDEEVARIVTALEYHIPFDFFTISWKNKSGKSAEVRAFQKTDEMIFRLLGKDEFFLLIDKTAAELPALATFSSDTTKAVCLTGNNFTDICRANSFEQLLRRNFGVNSALIKTFEICSWGQLSFSLYSTGEKGFKQQHALLLDRLDLLLVRISDQLPEIKKLGKVETQSGFLADVTENLSNEITTNTITNTMQIVGERMGLVGEAPVFTKIKEQVSTVASFDISVLILGESGTGKEKIAQAIHNFSDRKNKPMIKVNCAAIPAALIEAELFGYEKGAFTGAFDRRIGKFEQANGGTIFLDEIGDIPLDLQVKLLCVLQEREIVRLGSNQVVKVDIRIIAATNCNLEKAIAAGHFRLDLYYRLNVFPINMPPLRSRKEDIPGLSRYFVTKLTGKMGRGPKDISENALKALMAYDWPGNIRELENIIERSLVLNRGSIIEQVELPENQIKETPKIFPEGRIKTIRELE